MAIDDSHPDNDGKDEPQGGGSLAVTAWSRRAVLAVAAGLSVRASGVAAAQHSLREHSLGSDEAAVTVIEYASLTCVHCAELHKKAFKGVITQWIKAGRLRFVYRHFPLDNLALAAAVLTECLPGERFFPFIDVLFRNHHEWTRSEKPKKELMHYAALSGLSSQAVKQCWDDQEKITAVIEAARRGQQEFSVTGTPALIINGKTFSGPPNEAAITKALEKAEQDAK